MSVLVYTRVVKDTQLGYAAVPVVVPAAVLVVVVLVVEIVHIEVGVVENNSVVLAPVNYY